MTMTKKIFLLLLVLTVSLNLLAQSTPTMGWSS